MKKIVLVIALGVLAGASGTAHAQVLGRETSVVDQASLELQLRESAGDLVVDLVTGGTTTRDAGAIVVLISPDAAIDAVTVRVGPSPGIGMEKQLRLLYKTDVDVSSIPSTEGSVALEIPVAPDGKEARVDYVVELFDERASTTIASSGYIRIKKLNSGG